MSYFPYFSELKNFRNLKNKDKNQPVSILKSAITGSYLMTRNSRVLKNNVTILLWV